MKYSIVHRFLFFSAVFLLSISCTRNVSKEIEGVNIEEVSSWLKHNGGNFSNGTIVFQNKNQKSLVGLLDWSLAEKRTWRESEIIKVPFIFEGNSFSKNNKILNRSGFEKEPVMAAIYIKKDKDGSIEALVKVNTYKDVTNIENRAKTVEVFSLASKLVKEKITNGVYVGYAVLSDGESTVGSTVNRSAGGYDCETIVSYRKKSSWSDCDGSHTGGCYGHITLTTIKESRTKCYVSLGGNQEQIDWIEDDNFGMPYEEYEEEVVEEKVVKKDPCAEAKKNDSIAMTLLKNLLVKGKKDSIMASVASDTVEKSFTFGKDASGTIRTTNIAKGTRLQSAPMSPTNSNFIVQGAGHSHTKDGYAALSPGDIYSFNTANRANGQFRYFFGFASSGDTYLFTIIDSTVFADFVAKYPMNSVFDIKDQGWLENSDIGQDYNMIFDACIRQGYTKDAADEAAQAYVIKEFKMGIALSKSDANGNFKGVFYDTKPTGMVTQPYTIAKATNCNY